MEQYLGSIYKSPSRDKSTGKWNYVEIEYETQDNFNDATTKLLSIMYQNNSTGKCVVGDYKGNKYELSIIHSVVNAEEQMIKVLPTECYMLGSN